MTAKADLKSAHGDVVTWRNGPVQWLMFNRPRRNDGPELLDPAAPRPRFQLELTPPP